MGSEGQSVLKNLANLDDFTRLERTAASLFSIDIMTHRLLFCQNKDGDFELDFSGFTLRRESNLPENNQSLFS